MVVATALTVVGVVLTLESIRALASRRPLPTLGSNGAVLDAGEGFERHLSRVDVFGGRMRRA